MDPDAVHPIKAHVLAQQAAGESLSLTDIATRAGMTYVHLTRIMTGACNVSADLFSRLEDATGGACGADELFRFYRERRALRQAREAASAASD